MSVGDRLRQVRGQKTLQEFAEKLAVGGSNISNIENGRSKLSIDLAIQVAKHYEISIDWLLLGVGQMKLGEFVSEPNSDYVTISKDELIALQRVTIEKQNIILDDREKQIESLRKQ